MGGILTYSDSASASSPGETRFLSTSSFSTGFPSVFDSSRTMLRKSLLTLTRLSRIARTLSDAALSIGPFRQRLPLSYTNPRRRIIQKPAFARRRPPRYYSSTVTGIPIRIIRISFSAFQLASRKQPCEPVRPISSGRGVPCTP